MIVDLLRNDLNTISEPGSVRVPKLFEIERYPTVLQMTSTIEAKVSKDRTLFEIFRGLFPCGSITGAPKINTMKFIAEFETSPREVYCGAIGFITPEKEAVFNVPIRTVWIEHSTGKATYGVGEVSLGIPPLKVSIMKFLQKLRCLKKIAQSFKYLKVYCWKTANISC